MFSVRPDFIWDFKIGDNVHNTLKVIDLLYRQYQTAGNTERALLCKPIIILLVSIIEAFLYDFHVRARDSTFERMELVAEEVVAQLRAKKFQLDKFAICIERAEQADLFKNANKTFYKTLNELRETRNRIHIQNDKKQHPLHEDQLFTPLNKVHAEKALERVAKILETHGRPNHTAPTHLTDFQFPWQAHLRDTDLTA